MFVEDQNPEIFEQLSKNKALFETKPSENNTVDGEALEPTLENLQKALQSKQVSDKEYYHEASKIKFKLCPMSSSGYTALNNVARFNPLTQAKISTDLEDERERAIVYLTHGVSKPKLTRQSAQQVLDAPGWGPSNIGLIDAIIQINPSAAERTNLFVYLQGLAKFQIIWFRIMEECGGLDAYCKELNIKDDIKESLRTCFAMFSYLFSIDETSNAWGIPLGEGTLQKEPVLEEENGEEEEASPVESEDEVTPKTTKKK